MKILTAEEIQEQIKQERIRLEGLNNELNRIRSKRHYVKNKIKKLLEISPNQVEMDFDTITF